MHIGTCGRISIHVNAYIIRIDADSIYAKSHAIHNAVYIEYNCIYIIHVEYVI